MVTNFPIMLEQEKDGAYLVGASLSRELPKCGVTIHDAIGNMNILLAAYLEHLRADANPAFVEDDDEFEVMVS